MNWRLKLLPTNRVRLQWLTCNIGLNIHLLLLLSVRNYCVFIALTRLLQTVDHILIVVFIFTFRTHILRYSYIIVLFWCCFWGMMSSLRAAYDHRLRFGFWNHLFDNSRNFFFFADFYGFDDRFLFDLRRRLRWLII